MLHWLDIKIEREDQDIAKQKKQMDGDFLYYFEWNAESLYKSHFMSDCYKKLRQALDGVKDTDEIRNILKENAVRRNCWTANWIIEVPAGERTWPIP